MLKCNYVAAVTYFLKGFKPFCCTHDNQLYFLPLYDAFGYRTFYSLILGTRCDRLKIKPNKIIINRNEVKDILNHFNYRPLERFEHIALLTKWKMCIGTIKEKKTWSLII